MAVQEPHIGDRRLPGGGESTEAITLDAFVSYARVDSEHAESMVEGARRHNRMLWIDSDGIPPGAPWRSELGSALEAALAFVCILSPHWLRSHECELEYRRAVELGKRIIPVLIGETDAVPPAISSLNWIDARTASTDDVVVTLLKAIDTDYERVKEHTNLLARALRWSESDGDRSLLLRGAELLSAEELTALAGAQPETTALQRRYVAASREDERRRRYRRNVSVAAAAAITLVLATVAVLQLEAKNASRRQAQSRAIAAEALTQLGTDPERSLLLAQAAWRTSQTPQALNAMELAVAASRARLDVTGLPPAANRVGWLAGDQTIIAAGGSGELRASSAIDGDTRGAINVGTGGVVGLSEDEVGNLGVAATTGGQAVLWRASPSGQLAKIAELASAGAANVAISANGATAAVRRRDGTVTVWQLPALASRTVRVGPAGFIGCIALSPDGTRMLVGSSNGTAELWRAGESPRQVTRYATPVGQCSFDPTGTTMLTASQDGSATIEDVTDGRVRRRAGHVFQAALSRGGRFLGTSDIDGNVHLYDFARGTDMPLQTRGAVEIALAFSDSGAQLAAAGSDGIARVWQTDGRGRAIELRGATQHLTSLQFSHDGRFLLTGDGSGAVIKWALPSVPLALAVRPRQSSTADVTSVSLSSDGAVAMTTAGFLWSSDTRTGQTACARPLPCSTPSVAIGSLAAKVFLAEGYLSTAVFSPDGTRVAVGSQSGRLTIWRLADGNELSSATLGHGRIDTLAFSRDGRLLVVSDRTGRARLLDGVSARQVAVLSRDRASVFAATFTSGGRVVTANAAGAMFLWDSRGHFLRTLANVHDVVLGLAADPRGGSIAVASGSQIAIVRLTDGHVAQVLNSNAGDISSLAYVARTGLIAAGSVDRTMTVWDPRTGEPAQSFTLPSGVTSVAVSRSGELIAVGTTATGADVLRCDVCAAPAGLAAIAARDSTRALTARERADFKVPAGVLTGRPVAGCLGACTTNAAGSSRSPTPARTNAAPAAGAGARSPAKAAFINRADAICMRAGTALAPIQARLAADETRADASLASDAPQNRARLAGDWATVATIYRQKLADLRALAPPAGDQVTAEQYVNAFGAEIPLIDELAAGWRAPAGSAVSVQHVRSTGTLIAISQRVQAAQQATISAATNYGFHVCGKAR